MAMTSVPVPVIATLPEDGAASVTALANVVVSIAWHKLRAETQTLLNVPAPPANVTMPLHGVIVTTPAVDESAALPHPINAEFVIAAVPFGEPVTCTICVGAVPPGFLVIAVPLKLTVPPLSITAIGDPSSPPVRRRSHSAW